MLNSRDFCTLYSTFYGEQIDCLEKLKHAVFDGHELFEFVKYIEQNLANGVQASEATAILPHVSNRRELLLAYHEFYLKWRGSVSNSNPEYAVDAFLSKQ